MTNPVGQGVTATDKVMQYGQPRDLLVKVLWHADNPAASFVSKLFRSCNRDAIPLLRTYRQLENKQFNSIANLGPVLTRLVQNNMHEKLRDLVASDAFKNCQFSDTDIAAMSQAMISAALKGQSEVVNILGGSKLKYSFIPKLLEAMKAAVTAGRVDDVMAMLESASFYPASVFAGYALGIAATHDQSGVIKSLFESRWFDAIPANLLGNALVNATTGDHPAIVKDILGCPRRKEISPDAFARAYDRLARPFETPHAAEIRSLLEAATNKLGVSPGN